MLTVQKYTRARPQFTSKMSDRGISISIPHGYSKNSLPNKTQTHINIGKISTSQITLIYLVFPQVLISKTFLMSMIETLVSH